VFMMSVTVISDQAEQTMLQDCLWLMDFARQANIDARTIRPLLARWISIAGLRQASPADVAASVSGTPAKISRIRAVLANRRWQQQILADAEKAAAKGIRAVFYGAADFPGRLNEAINGPLVLFYRSRRYAEVISQPFFVTVIGTRTPTEYGKLVARTISGELAEQGIVIVSGMARGIDAIAHQTALNRGALTIAVLGNGPDEAYPPEHAKLLDQIADEGLVVSEYPPGTPPRPQHFPARNRILSGLADAVAVIEAARDSGTMITAGFAADQGRDVFAVPGNIVSTFSQGCNQLIADGAYVLQSAQDLLRRLPTGSMQTRIEQWIRQSSAYSDASGQDQAMDAQGGQPAEPATPLHEIIRLLVAAPLTLAEIAEKRGLSIAQTSVLITALELQGQICSRKGRYTLTEAALCSI
jgi:DNA processing protein